MKKDVLTSRISMCIIILIMYGSSLVVGISTTVGQDSWIAIIIAGIIACPIFIMFARIIKLFPGKDLFQIIEVSLGKIVGKVVIVLMVCYAQLLSALVLRNFTEFIEITSLTETPQIPLALAMIVSVIYICKSSIATFGKWSAVIVTICTSIIIIMFILSYADFNFENLTPILEHKFSDITYSALSILAFPLGETVMFLGIASSVKHEASPYKFMLGGLGLTTFFMLLVNMRNYLVLGAPINEISYFPSYTSVGLIKISQYISRIEGSISLSFVLSGLTKLSVCCMTTAIGITRLFGMENYKDTVIPITLTSVALSVTVYRNAMDMVAFFEDYVIFALPFQVLIPFIVWIASEIKSRKTKKEYAKQAS